jgi:hypothetical protein
MKMPHHQVAQIVFPTQVAHDLGDGPFGKSPMGLHAYRQQIGEHLDQ